MFCCPCIDTDCQTVFQNSRSPQQEGRGLNARPRRQIDWMKGYMAGLAFWASSASASLHFTIQKPLKTFMLRSGEVEAIQVHDLGPGRHEVLDKLLLRVRASIDLGQGPELGVRTEDEVDTRAGPLDFASLAIATFKYVLGRPIPPSTPCPCRAGSRRSRWSALPAAW